eukprot:06047.XXX_226633_225544_1 [CDS] Oithona nana genome sequencing.
MRRSFTRLFSSSSLSTKDVFIVSCARTPLGAFQGSLMEKSATQLGGEAISAAVAKAKIPSKAVQEVMMGCVLQGGLGQAPARQAALNAGLDISTPSTTVNKVCASGMKAIMLNAANLALGLQDVVISGGMESLSNSPFYLQRGSTPYGEVKLRDACHFDALTDARSAWHMGQCAEKTAGDLKISRKEQDDYARLSLKRLEIALKEEAFKDEIIAIDAIETDDNMNPFEISDIDTMPTPWGSTVTRASASKLADGAAACVLMNQDGLDKYNVKPQAKILGFTDAAQDPLDWPTTPAIGMQKLLKNLGLQVQDIDMFEINEAFAVV